MATNTGIKFYSKSLGADAALALSKSASGSIVFDKTSKAIYVNGVKYCGSNVADATFSSNKLTITKNDNSQIELDFSTLATTHSVMAVFDQIKDSLTMDDGAGTYVASGDTSYVSSDTLTSVNKTNVIDTTGSDATMVDAAVAMVDKKTKATLNEVIAAKKEIDAVETGAGLGADGSYTANTSTKYINDAKSLKDADEKLDTAIKDVSGIVNSLKSGTVSDVKINNTSIKTNGIAEIAVDGAYDASTNKIASQTTVINAINALDTKSDVQAVAYTAADANNGAKLTFNGVSETDGVIAQGTGTTELQFAKVATTGAAADVSIADTANKIEATTVEGALAELATTIEGNKITIASGEKIISKSDSNELSSTLSIAIEKQGEEGNRKDYIVLKGIGNAEVAKVDASAFVKDGMLESAELVTTAESGVSEKVPYIKLTFNTESGKQPLRFSVTSLVDTYTSGNTTALTVENYTITPNTGAVAENAGTLTTGGQVYTAIAATKGQDIQTITGETATTDGGYIDVKVIATKGASDDNYTLSTTSNVTTQAVSEADATHKGLAEASDVKSYVDGKVGTAIQSVGGSTTEKAKTVTQSDYATVKVTATTDASNNVTLDSAVGLTVQTVSEADATHKGLAEASDVKSYVDTHKAAVTNNSATIPVNSSTDTTIATVDGTAITAKASFTWEEYE